jgi:hypothetical protein
MPWPQVLGLVAVILLVVMLPVGIIILDPADNMVTPFISTADIIVAQDKSLATCTLLLLIPLPFCIVVARLNPFQKLPRKKADQHWHNWKWALHKLTVYTLIASFGGMVLLGFTGVFLQPLVMNGRGYDMCWQVKVPSTFGAAEQAYAKRGVTCPAKPAVDEWGYWRK